MIQVTDAICQGADREVFGCVWHEVPHHPFPCEEHTYSFGEALKYIVRAFKATVWDFFGIQHIKCPYTLKKGVPKEPFSDQFSKEPLFFFRVKNILKT